MGEDNDSYPYAHQYSNEYGTYIYDVNNDSEYNEYHYPKQKNDYEWPQYHYGTDIQAPSQSEYENEGETNESLMLEEDDDNVVYDDGFDQ